ncbi:LacI family DNA-binding transcriptional regulator [Roseateles asaccharophilus]|uniref:LacI family transcriptional regulator n=1 Tax=Roseateles asaccharophilus TaxID=582607 RepID=A0ABU2A966_9BURK|nr:LacI family DNA-binding transcriptional regulator [Roseateles asaccharophilus]MDR7333746.1 LacI family transcriptional regulator [Roseateles asaccharophilus]
MKDKTPPAKKAQSSRPDGVVTLEQVAELAGVSPSTVSRILNGTAAVSEAKKEAVEAAIRELGFRPNPVARGLAGGKTMSIGVVTQIISSPFYGEALLGIERELERAGYVPLFVSGNWHEDDERKAIEALLSRRVDGIIVLAGRLPNEQLVSLAGGLPTVVVGRQVQGPRIYSFSFDNRLGARLATQHLIDQGHRRIAFIAGDLMHDDAVERQDGYLAAMAAAGLPVEPDLVVQSDFTAAGGMLAVSRLLERDVSFTALFVSNDEMAMGACLGLHRRNLRVPDDVSMVGFDDVVMARYTMPPLTTVRQSVYEIGTEAAAAMLAMLRGEQPKAQPPGPELIVRESTRRLLR